MATKMSDPVRRVKQDAFLAHYAKPGVVKRAAEAGEIHRSTHPYLHETNPH